MKRKKKTIRAEGLTVIFPQTGSQIEVTLRDEEDMGGLVKIYCDLLSKYRIPFAIRKVKQ